MNWLFLVNQYIPLSLARLYESDILINCSKDSRGTGLTLLNQESESKLNELCQSGY